MKHTPRAAGRPCVLEVPGAARVDLILLRAPGLHRHQKHTGCQSAESRAVQEPGPRCSHSTCYLKPWSSVTQTGLLGMAGEADDIQGLISSNVSEQGPASLRTSWLLSAVARILSLVSLLSPQGTEIVS